jgi:hypothetical protein
MLEAKYLGAFSHHQRVPKTIPKGVSTDSDDGHGAAAVLARPSTWWLTQLLPRTL